MKKIIYLPFAALLLITASCSMSTNTVKESAANTPAKSVEKEFFAVLKVSDTIATKDSVLLTFTVYNHTDSVKKFLKWQTPFEPLMSKYLDVKNEQGEEALYKGPMAKRMMPPPAAAYIALNPNDSLTVKVDLLKGYAITAPGKYTVAYTSEGMSGIKVRGPVSFIYK